MSAHTITPGPGQQFVCISHAHCDMFPGYVDAANGDTGHVNG